MTGYAQEPITIHGQLTEGFLKIKGFVHRLTTPDFRSDDLLERKVQVLIEITNAMQETETITAEFPFWADGWKHRKALEDEVWLLLLCTGGRFNSDIMRPSKYEWSLL